MMPARASFRLPVRGSLVGAAMALALASVPGPACAQGWKPDRGIEIITGASPGGGNDRLVRVIQRIVQERRLIAVPSTVLNKPGGGNAISWSYLNQHPGDGHFVALANPNLMTNQLTGKSALTYLDFTPISLLLSEYVTFVVRSDSPVKSGRDLLEVLRKDSGALSVSVGSALGGVNHIALALLARAAGGDPRKLKTVVFNAQGEAMVALLGGHITAISASASNTTELLQTGKIRVLGVSSPRRLGGPFAEVPTWKELGIDVVASNWRAMIGPKDLSTAQTAFWEDLFARIAKTGEWQHEADTYLLQNTYMGSRDTAAYFKAQRAELQAMLSDLGLAK
jgi:putative tricarboxylic transport membrane protein